MRATFFIITTYLFSVCNSFANGVERCIADGYVKPNEGYQLLVDDRYVVRQLLPSFFGFNLEWLEFEFGIWDKQRKAVKSEVLEFMQTFPGAIYRYPGGNNSNHFVWSDAIGPYEHRPKKKQVAWLDPRSVSFGPEEYLKFVHDVGGEAWYVANLYGQFDKELPADVVAKSAGDLATLLRKLNENGMPPVLRWELGNELDRNLYHWTPQKFSTIARAVSKEIQKNDAKAKFVTLLEEYPAMDKAGYSASSYNRALAKDVKTFVDEYAIHLYYDGKPGGPPIKNQLTAMCRAIDDARSVGIKNPSVWVTEHARVPEGAFTTPDWKKLWPETANLQAAISVADMLIATVQIPEVKGTMIHALHASTGPWPLFHAQRSGNIYPSKVMLVMRIFRESMLPEVLHSTSESANTSGYEGGYDVRAVVMSEQKRKQYVIWTVNRDGHPVDLKISIPSLKGAIMSAKQVSLTDENIKANNYIYSQRLQQLEKKLVLVFDSTGTTHIKLPTYSISSFELSFNDTTIKK